MIQFVNDIDEAKLRMAYNNDVIRFYSDKALPPLYADVTLTESSLILLADTDPQVYFSARLYPNPQGQFYINLQPYVAAALNTRNFHDTLQPNIISGSASSFTYSFADGTFLTGNLSISVAHNGESPDTVTKSLAWIAGSQQIDSYTRLAKTNMLLLSPFKKDSAQEYYLKYWQGYPFDISIFNSVGSLIIFNGLEVFNETNGLARSFSPARNVTRLVFSDGRSDETLETVLPLAEGTNRLRLAYNTKQTRAVVEKIPYRNGVYLKWLNALGGYSYWLFEDTYAIDRSTKYNGEIGSDNANVENSIGRTLQIGKTSQDSIKIVAELLTEDERRIVDGILDSPKIYLFTGKPFSQNSYRNWAEVTLKTGSARLKNFKQPLTNFSFDIELPVRYTQSL